ncbi:unnamed protein product [Linum tenue]|uniref:Uncharacterized protein n=1 Tax=Linum tenue TaxID=586396 RepID=A0AAV0KWD6_9ROSI|nr:unnamed protein product [Linum tenue]
MHILGILSLTKRKMWNCIYRIPQLQRNFGGRDVGRISAENQQNQVIDGSSKATKVWMKGIQRETRSTDGWLRSSHRVCLVMLWSSIQLLWVLLMEIEGC